MEAIKVQNGITTYEAAKARVEAGFDKAHNSARSNIWEGGNCETTFWVADVQERIDYINNK